MCNIPFCEFCIGHYGGAYEFREMDFGTNIRISVGNDVFKINLTDKNRFGKYTLNHRDSGRRLDGKYYFHKQIETKNLALALYIAWTHEFNKSLGIEYSREDFARFFEDYKKWLELQKLETF